MFTFALRCPENEYAALVVALQTLGVIDQDDPSQIVALNGGYFDFIGYKIQTDGLVLQNTDGIPYIHINLQTTIDVAGTAAAPWLLTDINGQPTLPKVPLRVFL